MRCDKLIGIVASDPRGVIGNKGKLPWQDPEELTHFQKTIGNHPIVMGYKTYQALPKHYFLNRRSIVFTRKHHFSFPGFVSSLEEFLSLDEVFEKVYVIGGGEIFTLFLQENLLEECILTKMKKEYVGDVSFPLHFIKKWRDEKIQESKNFTIYHYFNEAL